MELNQKQKDIEEHQKNVSIMMQRIENKPFLTLDVIDSLITEMYRLNCFEEVLMSAVIDKCLESDKKALFDKYLLEDTCDLVMRRGMVVFQYQGDFDYKCYQMLILYYTDSWLFKIPISIVNKLAEKYSTIKKNVLPIRNTKYFQLDWSWVKFYDGYMVIEKSNSSDGIIFDKYVFYSPLIRGLFDSLLFFVKDRIKQVGCKAKMKQLFIDERFLTYNLQVLREKYDSLYKDGKSTTYTSNHDGRGGGGWGPKYGTEYVSEHHRSGHWRHCASGKIVWVNACTVSGHPRTY